MELVLCPLGSDSWSRPALSKHVLKGPDSKYYFRVCGSKGKTEGVMYLYNQQNKTNRTKKNHNYLKCKSSPSRLLVAEWLALQCSAGLMPSELLPGWRLRVSTVGLVYI